MAYFCFHCQKDVKPMRFLLWRFCPHCHRKITDDENGFYRICDNCGANLPPNADKCLKCGFVFNKNNARELFQINSFYQKTWFNILIGTVLFLCVIPVLIGIFYLSFYVLMAILLLIAITWLLNIFFKIRL